jgi:hypothetical protein
MRTRSWLTFLLTLGLTAFLGFQQAAATGGQTGQPRLIVASLFANHYSNLISDSILILRL